MYPKDADRMAYSVNWATSWENLITPYANNKDADQPAHPHSLDSIIYLVSILAVSWLVENPEDRFSRDEAQLIWAYIVCNH